MRWFRDLNIGTKFNIIMIILMVALFVSAASYSYNRQQGLIIKGAVDNARIIAREIIEAREYMSSVVKGEPASNYNLVPQVVATQIARKITQNSQYYVRQVSLRYRNPDNRPDEYETAKLKTFTGKEARETYDIIETQRGKELRFMLPMRAEKSCLECHSTYEKAPRFVQARFPKGHFSYGYQIGDIIGAVSVIIPLASLYKDLSYNLNVDIFYRGGMFLIVMFLIGMLIRRAIIVPVSAVSSSITKAARTGNYTQRLPVASSDEVGQLIQAFNEMMEELEHKTQQSRESEDRYRNFIKMAQSAVVTFMEDGKIVITNEKAERLLGMERRDLLGENVYDFIENGEELQSTITTFLQTNESGVVADAAMHRIKNAAGYYAKVEVAISASRTDGSTMLTAILREQKDS